MRKELKTKCCNLVNFRRESKQKENICLNFEERKPRKVASISKEKKTSRKERYIEKKEGLGQQRGNLPLVGEERDQIRIVLSLCSKIYCILKILAKRKKMHFLLNYGTSKIFLTLSFHLICILQRLLKIMLTLSTVGFVNCSDNKCIIFCKIFQIFQEVKS